MVLHIFFVVSTDKGYAQATFVTSQCSICLLFGQPTSLGSHTEAIQHKTQVPKFIDPLLAGTVGLVHGTLPSLKHMENFPLARVTNQSRRHATVLWRFNR